MNLAAYDKVKLKINKAGTWLDKEKGILLSREIVKRRYYTFVKKFEPDKCVTLYFIVLLDDNPGDRQVFRTRIDDYGRLKFNISSIAKESGLNKFETNTNISLLHIEHTDDGDIYQIDI